MAIYSLSEWFLTPSGDKSRQLCMEVVDGEAVNAPPLVTRERSRGRHDPGDGPYVNRIAIGGKTIVEVPGSSVEYILQGSNELFGVPQPGGYTARFYEDWTNCTHCRLSVSDNQPRDWGYYLDVRAYLYFDGWIWSRRYIASDYGYSEKEAEALGIQLFNQYMGVGVWALPEPWQYQKPPKPLSGVKSAIAPKLSNQFIGPVDTLDADYVNRRIETGLASAFVDACDKLPSSTGINNIANVADVISSFKSMSKGLTKVGSAADAWLSYRYSYSTTKSDIIALSDFANRIAALPELIHSNGYYKDGDWEYRVSINVTSPYLSSLVSFGEKWGIALDAVNAWDLIPYSFIVDWFIPVSNLLERWQSQSFAMQIQQTSWCSVRHEYVNEFGFKEIDYSRFLYEPQARFASVSHIAYGQKASTIVKRALDVLALFA